MKSLKESPGRRAIAVVGGMAGVLFLFTSLQAVELTPPVTYPAGINPMYVTSADFNGDGAPDLASVQSGSWPSGSPSTVALFRGNGDGTFVPAGTMPAGPNGWGIAAGDLNGDGRIDLATVNRAVNYPVGNVTWYPGNGDGTFQPPRQLAAGRQPCSFALADIDGDADVDIVIGNHGDSGAGSNLEILFGDGTGNFAELMPRIPLEGAGINDVQIVDLNSDGVLDIVTANWWRSTVSVLLGIGGGAFGPPSDFAIGYRCDSVAVADFNEDGNLDLVAADQEFCLSLLFGRGDGTFLPRQRLSTGIWSQEIVALDMDRDGHYDVVFADRSGNAASVLSGNGNGTFKAPLRFASAATPWGLKVADLNRDGYEDVAMAHDGSSANVVSVLLQVPPFCASQTDPRIVFCEDFSGPNPLANYNFENPPGGGQSPMAIGINNEALTLDYVSGFGVAWAKSKSQFGFRDTFFESELRLETSNAGEPRSAGYIGWVDGTTGNGYLLLLLQLDENRAYIFVGKGSANTSTSSPLQVDKNVTYRLRLEVKSPNIIRGYVDDVLVVSLNFDLSVFPAQMTPGMSANSHGSVRIRHDNLVVRTMNQPPVAKCKSVSVAAGADCNAAASIDDGSYDPDSGDTITVSQNPPGPYPLGDTLVTLTVTDNHGASASCTATVTVSDTTPPVITCPANMTRTTDAGQCSAVVNFTVSAADNCGSATVACLPPSGSAFPKGVTSVACAAVDAAGNTATCAFTVTVNDVEAPVITCPADITLPCAVDRLLPATFVATATDNCDPAPAVTYSIPSGSGFPIGVTVVTATATDASGNSAQCMFSVTRAALEFVGFLPPIGGADATGGSFASPVRTFKLKSTVPVKFTASCGGSPVLTGVHTLQAIKWSNETDAQPPMDATPTDAATTGNQFRLTDGVWHFNLDTVATGMSAGKWQLVATLSDGSQHSVWIQIR